MDADQTTHVREQLVEHLRVADREADPAAGYR